MKKLIYLIMVLFLTSCGSSTVSNVSTETTKEISSAKVSVQSILSNLDKTEYKEGELLVKFKSGVKAASSARVHQSVGANVMRKFSLINADQVKLPAGVSVRDAVEQYMQDSNVEYAEPNYVRCSAATVPNDPYFDPQQWALQNEGLFAGGVAGADVSATRAWDISKGDSTVIIAVLDTGIDYNHQDLVNNIWSNASESCVDGIDHDGNGYVNDCRGWDFVNDDNDPVDDDGHGTHVAGIIGAVGNNHLGTSGMMWQVKLMPLKILDVFGSGSCGGPGGFVADEVAAIQYAVAKGAKVINASFRGCGFSNTEYDAIAGAGAAGVLFVAAAGNGGLDSMGENNDINPLFPASYALSNIISVAATDQTDTLASFSNYGWNTVHVAAPGVYVLSTVPFEGLGESFASLCTGTFFAGYDFCSGTSMAAPHVAGLAGLLYSHYNGATNHFNFSQIRGLILRYVDTYVDSPNLQSIAGRVMTDGRVNAYKALSSLLVPTGLNASGISPTSIGLTWYDNATGEDKYVIERMQAGGPFTVIAETAPGAGSFTDTGLVSNVTYSYRVKASSTLPNPPSFVPVQAESDYSNVASATTPVLPAPTKNSGGGGCSVVGSRIPARAAAGDIGMFLLPLAVVLLARRRR